MMKKFIFAFFFAFAVSSISTVAQNNNRKKNTVKKSDRIEMIKKRTDRLVERYGLDEKQAAKLLELNEGYFAKLQTETRKSRVRQDGNKQSGEQVDGSEMFRPSKEQMEKMRKVMRERQEKYDAALKKIMTSEQYAKYEQDRKDMMKRAGRRNSGRRNR